ncbi:CRP/FNR family transcriptional regulator, cyclic AMP receptor protein, partial [Candidatus Hakubella thermalkaliphila]
VVIEGFYSKGREQNLEADKGEDFCNSRPGRVKISKASADGRQQILQILKDGDIFAEVILFDQGLYPATAEAAEDSTCWLLRSTDMGGLLQSQPLLAVTLLKIMSSHFLNY